MSMFLSLLAPDFVVMATYSAATRDKLDIMTIHVHAFYDILTIGCDTLNYPRYP